MLSVFIRQCTECDSSSSEDEDNKVDPNDNTSLLESRQKRNIKEPTKFTPGKDVSMRDVRGPAISAVILDEFLFFP